VNSEEPTIATLDRKIDALAAIVRTMADRVLHLHQTSFLPRWAQAVLVVVGAACGGALASVLVAGC